MLRFTRMFAKRLRSLTPLRHTLGSAHSGMNAWARLDVALTSYVPSHEERRMRELKEENIRLAVTLIGQRGSCVVRRVVLACEGDLSDARGVARLLLSLALKVGDEETRRAATVALASVTPSTM